MAKRRSPNYPSLSLEESIAQVQRIYSQEQRHTTPRGAVFQHLGYSSASGRALAQLAALRAYDLLDGRGDALRVTENAATILAFTEEPENPARQRALRECAFAPTVFRELFEEYGATPGSTLSIRHRLQNSGFLPKAAGEVIQTYRDNLAFLERQGVGYNEGQEPNETMPAPTTTGQDSRQMGEQLPTVRDAPPIMRMSGEQPGLREELTSIGEGVARASWPNPISEESLEELKMWLKMLELKIERSVKKAKDEDHPE